MIGAEKHRPASRVARPLRAEPLGGAASQAPATLGRATCDVAMPLPGYTVIELLVVMLLFAITITIMSQTYLTFIRLYHKMGYATIVQQDLRYFTEYTARLVRNTPVDYSSPVSAVASSLTLRPSGGTATIIKLSDYGDAYCADDPDVRCLLVSTDGGVGWAPLTSKHVNVDDFKVFVWPTISPFEYDSGIGDYNSNRQPFVTVYLKVTFMVKNLNERVSNDVQTTISSRVYVR